MTYESESWTLRKKDENDLSVIERKVLKKIYGSCKDEYTDEWRIRGYKNLYRSPSITEYIIKRGLKWAGHSWRKDGSLVRIIRENAPHGKPRLRWEAESKRTQIK